MSKTPPGEVTRLLKQWSDGDSGALAHLIPIVHEELSCLASASLKHERRHHTLETSALVNEAYVRLVDLKRVNSNNRTQFFSLAAHVIRNILVDHARGHLTAKRGAGIEPLPLEEVFHLSVNKAPELVALDEALKALATVYPNQARIVELRHFGGLTQEEVARVMETSVTSVARGWRMARAWLYDHLTEGEEEGEGA